MRTPVHYHKVQEQNVSGTDEYDNQRHRRTTVSLHKYINTYIHTLMHALIRADITTHDTHTYVHTYIHTTYMHTAYIHTDRHTYMHTAHIHTYMHTYIHTDRLLYTSVCAYMSMHTHISSGLCLTCTSLCQCRLHLCFPVLLD